MAKEFTKGTFCITKSRPVVPTTGRQIPITAASGTRTHTVAHWHLKPARLPIPPCPPGTGTVSALRNPFCLSSQLFSTFPVTIRKPMKISFSDKVCRTVFRSVYDYSGFAFLLSSTPPDFSRPRNTGKVFILFSDRM